MNKDRLRDIALGFVLCLALMGSYYCGSMSPTSANASPAGSSDFAIVGGMTSEFYFGYVVVDKSTGRVVFSESISRSALGTGGSSIGKSERYW